MGDLSNLGRSRTPVCLRIPPTVAYRQSISQHYPTTHTHSYSALEARFNEASPASPAAAANSSGGNAAGGGGEDAGALTAALAQARGENEALIGKMRELLGRHKALQKTAGEFKAAGDEAQR